MKPTLLIGLQRLRHDHSNGRAFFSHPYELEIHIPQSDDWLDPVARQLATEAYVPAPSAPVDVPKPGWHIRPGSILELRDELVYHTLVYQCLPVLDPLLSWSEGRIRQSNHLSHADGSWFQVAYRGWRDFQAKSIALLQSGLSHVLLTDIAGYYENIDLGRLIQELQVAGVAAPIPSMLSKCLNGWAEPRRRGIPQGYSPSDVLAEFYLDRVDRQLHAAGFVHLRYMDDIRVFATSDVGARRALHLLTTVLRERGLNLQTAKTEILLGADVIDRIERIPNLISGISAQLAAELREVGVAVTSAPGLSAAIRAFTEANPNRPPPDVLKRAWRAFESGELGAFDKTLYHYLIARFADAGLADAITYSLATIRDRPEETQISLEYLTAVRKALTDEVLDWLAALLAADDTIFEYQRHQLLRWFLVNGIVRPGVLTYVRGAIRRGESSRILRADILAYLGRFGEPYDHDHLSGIYVREQDWLTRATILCALREAPAPFRNSLYGRARGQHEIVDRALRWCTRV